MPRRAQLLALLGALAALCALSAAAAAPLVAVQVAPEVPASVAADVHALLPLCTGGAAVVDVAPNASLSDVAAALSAGSLVLAFGRSAAIVGALIDRARLDALGSEAFGAVCGPTAMQGVSVCAADGNVNSATMVQRALPTGVGFGVFDVLQHLGFVFAHPLQVQCASSQAQRALQPAALERYEAPYWPVRGTHYHTEHPLELMEVLNGFGIGGYKDEASWEAMLPEVAMYARWHVANKLNRVEWLLLRAEEYAEFVPSPLQQARQQQLTALFLDYGVAPGADVAIAEIQQHAWHMIDQDGTLEQDEAAIRSVIDYLVGCGFAYISTESGTSEFTHPTDTRMLEWMQYAAAYGENTHNVPVYIKCHCSTGQTCKDYKDPRTGQPLNFNFLPMLANSSLGIYPHTVQMYSFFDPSPTYGNDNFTYMLDFLLYEAPSRPTIYHGETAYWVNYDIDVPLFLPVYFTARLTDVRAIAKSELSTPVAKRSQGEVNFSSGWEWAYWLNEVLLARAVWNPHVADGLSDDAAVATIVGEFFNATFGPSVGPAWSELLIDVMTAEHELLVLGQVPGQKPPSDIAKRNGQAYIQGWDTWADIESLASHIVTQPSRTSPLEIRVPLLFKPDYDDLKPLLDAMDTTFAAFVPRCAALAAQTDAAGAALSGELCDALNVTSARIAQIAQLYEYAASEGQCGACMTAARAARVAFRETIARREASYRVPVDRIAGWRPNPTAYSYGYLWTAHSGYYAYRDEAKAALAFAEALSPCFMNIISPVDIVLGEGIGLNLTELLREALDGHSFEFVGDCLHAPDHEPVYPDNSAQRQPPLRVEHGHGHDGRRRERDEAARREVVSIPAERDE